MMDFLVQWEYGPEYADGELLSRLYVRELFVVG